MAFTTEIVLMVGVRFENIDVTRAEATGAPSNVPISILLDHVVFSDSPGGTCKMFLLWISTLSGKKEIAVATSGRVASLIHLGQTVYSTLKVSFLCREGHNRSLTTTSKLGPAIHNVDLIIWDEILKSHRHCTQAVDRTFKDNT